jgi:hypothetical protein
MLSLSEFNEQNPNQKIDLIEATNSSLSNIFYKRLNSDLLYVEKSALLDEGFMLDEMTKINFTLRNNSSWQKD